MKTRRPEVILKDYVKRDKSNEKRKKAVEGDLTGWNSESKEKTLRKRA
jgi:hypothetical protein